MWRELKYILSLAGCQAQVKLVFYPFMQGTMMLPTLPDIYLQQQTIHRS